MCLCTSSSHPASPPAVRGSSHPRGRWLYGWDDYPVLGTGTWQVAGIPQQDYNKHGAWLNLKRCLLFQRHHAIRICHQELEKNVTHILFQFLTPLPVASRHPQPAIQALGSCFGGSSCWDREVSVRPMTSTQQGTKPCSVWTAPSRYNSWEHTLKSLNRVAPCTMSLFTFSYVFRPLTTTSS